ncbi:MAG: FCD domain-containing protein [Spirochaetia bacterium]
MSKRAIDFFQPIDMEDPADKIIQQIRDMIHEGVLKPGDRLPSEKRIEERVGIGRGHVTRALRRLETYGILRTVPQSGSYVAAIGIDALESLATNILKLNDQNLESLMDVKFVLEKYAAESAVKSVTDEQIEELEEVSRSIAAKIEDGQVSFDEDMVFHLKIADMVQNAVLRSLLTLLSSQAITLFKDLEEKVGREKLMLRLHDAIEEHEEIVVALRARDSEQLVSVIAKHYDRAKFFRSHLDLENNSFQDS